MFDKKSPGMKYIYAMKHIYILIGSRFKKYTVKIFA